MRSLKEKCTCYNHLEPSPKCTWFQYLHQICFEVLKSDNSLYAWSQQGLLVIILYINALVIRRDILEIIKFEMKYLDKLRIAECKPISTPLDHNLKFYKDSGSVCGPT